jgi:hypothetical protein
MTIEMVDIDPNTIDPWSPSVQMTRDAVLREAIIGPDFRQAMKLRPEAEDSVLSVREVNTINDRSREAVLAGRLYDFGHLPNATLQHCGRRGGTLWQQHAIASPFTDSWMMYHTWEGGTGIYLSMPSPNGIEICELQPMLVGRLGMLMIGDRGIFWQNPPHDVTNKGYHVAIIPSMMRYHADPELAKIVNSGQGPLEAAAGNIGDPIMTAILLLNTRNVLRETIRADPKLQKARKKSGKEPIPPHDRVHTEAYVTAVNARRERGEDKGGTHRSPVPHVRQGHPRLYATGKSIFIHDTLVNVPDDQRETFKANRSHYKVTI